MKNLIFISISILWLSCSNNKSMMSDTPNMIEGTIVEIRETYPIQLVVESKGTQHEFFIDEQVNITGSVLESQSTNTLRTGLRIQLKLDTTQKPHQVKQIILRE